jgi:hypothetical protein
MSGFQAVYLEDGSTYLDVSVWKGLRNQADILNSASFIPQLSPLSKCLLRSSLSSMVKNQRRDLSFGLHQQSQDHKENYPVPDGRGQVGLYSESCEGRDWVSYPDSAKSGILHFLGGEKWPFKISSLLAFLVGGSLKGLGS